MVYLRSVVKVNGIHCSLAEALPQSANIELATHKCHPRTSSFKVSPRQGTSPANPTWCPTKGNWPNLNLTVVQWVLLNWCTMFISCMQVFFQVFMYAYAGLQAQVSLQVYKCPTANCAHPTPKVWLRHYQPEYVILYNFSEAGSWIAGYFIIWISLHAQTFN